MEQLPEGMRAVTEAEFFAFMGPRNVHPRPFADRSEWINQSTHKLEGVSRPGYMGSTPYGQPKEWFLAEVAR